MSDRVDIDGRYIVLKRLGEGGFGTVYLCNDPDLGREIAIKVIRRQETNDSQAKRFLNEAKALAKCKHPGIVKLTKFGITTDGVELYFAMEPLDGHSLAHELDVIGPLAPRRLLKLFAQIFDALEHAHQIGIVHRDLKPSNIMLCTKDGEEQAVLIDFGLMRAADNEVKITATGDVLGTPSYMSPEQCKGVAADYRSDIYSAGCCIYAAATGRPPFDGDGYSVLMDHLKTSPSGIPEYLHEFVSKCMDKDPEKRFQSARSAREALLSIEQNATFDTTLHVSEVHVATKSVSNARWKLLPILAALIFMVAVASFFIIYPPRAKSTREPDSSAPVVVENLSPENAFTRRIKMESHAEKSLLKEERTPASVKTAMKKCDSLLKEVQESLGERHYAVFHPIVCKAEIAYRYSDDEKDVDDALKQIKFLQTVPECQGSSKTSLVEQSKDNLLLRKSILEFRTAMDHGDLIKARANLNLNVKEDFDSKLKIEWGNAFVRYSRLLDARGQQVPRKEALKRALQLYGMPKAVQARYRDAITLLTSCDLSNDVDLVNSLVSYLQADQSANEIEQAQSWAQSAKLLYKIDRLEDYRSAILRAINLSSRYEPLPKFNTFDSIHHLVSREPALSKPYLPLAKNSYENFKLCRDAYPRLYAQTACDLATTEHANQLEDESIEHFREAERVAQEGARLAVSAEEKFRCKLLSVEAKIRLFKVAPNHKQSLTRAQILTAIAGLDSPACRTVLTEELNSN